MQASKELLRCGWRVRLAVAVSNFSNGDRCGKIATEVRLLTPEVLGKGCSIRTSHLPETSFVVLDVAFSNAGSQIVATQLHHDLNPKIVSAGEVVKLVTWCFLE